jgi:hypothetical protein
MLLRGMSWQHSLLIRDSVRSQAAVSWSIHTFNGEYGMTDGSAAIRDTSEEYVE